MANEERDIININSITKDGYVIKLQAYTASKIDCLLQNISYDSIINRPNCLLLDNIDQTILGNKTFASSIVINPGKSAAGTIYGNTHICHYNENSEVQRTYLFPDKDGTFAMTSDITNTIYKHTIKMYKYYADDKTIGFVFWFDILSTNNKALTLTEIENILTGNKITARGIQKISAASSYVEYCAIGNYTSKNTSVTCIELDLADTEDSIDISDSLIEDSISQIK